MYPADNSCHTHVGLAVFFNGGFKRSDLRPLCQYWEGEGSIQSNIRHHEQPKPEPYPDPSDLPNGLRNTDISSLRHKRPDKFDRFIASLVATGSAHIISRYRPDAQASREGGAWNQPHRFWATDGLLNRFTTGEWWQYLQRSLCAVIVSSLTIPQALNLPIPDRC